MYFDHKTIKQMFATAIDDYNLYNFSPIEERKEWKKDVEQGYKRQSDGTLKLFRTLFCDKKFFCSMENTKAYLQKRQDKPDGTVDTLMAWTKDKLKKLESIGQEYKHCFEAGTVEEYSEKIEPLLFGASQMEEPSLWPLIKAVRYVLATALSQLQLLT